jgi:hypothetical protein
MRTRRSAPWALLAVIPSMLLSGCQTAPLRAGPARTIQSLSESQMREMGYEQFADEPGTITDAQRRDFIRRAQVWFPGSITQKDLLDLTGEPGGQPFESELSCTYTTEHLFGGSTLKFGCKLDDGEILKVKPGPQNDEVYAEILGTRLTWALGFAADRMYPVILHCAGCENYDGRVNGVADRNGKRRFDVAAYERKFRGHKLETSAGSGWSWPELDLVDSRAGGATREQLDALKLLAVFMQQWDTKADNQRLICPDEYFSKDPDGTVQCSHPILMMQDMGASFGSWQGLKRADPEAWKNESLWVGGSVTSSSAGEETAAPPPPGKKKRKTKHGQAEVAAPAAVSHGSCVANMGDWGNTTLVNPTISEDGRAFLAGLLSQLTREQLRSMFRAGLVEKKGQTIEQWLDAWDHRYSQLVNRRCD